MKANIAVSSSAALLAAFALAGLRAAPPQADPPTPANNQEGKSAASSIERYRNWTRVNPKPFEVSAAFSMLCITPPPSVLAKLKAENDSNPHIDHSPGAERRNFRQTRFVTVYVNAVGASTMLKAKHPLFPVGSVIVKEKLATPTSDAPELLTVMRKRETGYNPTGGDWEYLTFDGAGKRVQAQGKLKNCVACHASRKDTDYVARTYLTEAALKALK